MKENQLSEDPVRNVAGMGLIPDGAEGPLFDTSYVSRLRNDIVRCVEQLSIPPPAPMPASKVFDPTLMADLDNRLTRARQTAQQNARRLVTAHHDEFPESPLFCSCSLLGPLGQGRRELSVTQILGWLFDPNEDHGFDGILLRAFLLTLKDDSEAATRIIASNDRDISVYTEFCLDQKNRADIVIVSNGSAVVIEAKIDAGEGRAQTQRYAREFEKNFPVCTYVYLTPLGEEAVEAGFRPYRYLELVRALIRALNSAGNAEGFHYARYFLSGLLQDVCGLNTSNNLEHVLKGNSFELEGLLEDQAHG